jgi:hypothetical protein
MIFDTSPLLAHVAGVPVEEVLPGVLACGFVGVRVATVSIRNRFSRSAGRRSKGARASNGKAQ